MKVTTVRFGTDLWRLLEAEAAFAGVSTSQYIREAALARAAAAAATRGHGPFDLLAGALRETVHGETDPDRRLEASRVLAGLARLTASESRDDSLALKRESEQSIRHSRAAIKRAESATGS